MKNRVWHSYLCNWKTAPKKVSKIDEKHILIVSSIERWKGTFLRTHTMLRNEIKECLLAAGMSLSLKFD